MTARTQEILFGTASQALVLDCEDGRPSSVTSVSVWPAYADDTTAVEDATTGSPTVETNPATTLASAAGPGNLADPTALVLTAGTGVAIGRVYRLTEDGTGVYEDVEVSSVSGVNVTLRHPLRNDYSAGSTFQSTRCTQTLSTAWVSEVSNLSPAFSPNPTYRAKWVIVIGGETRVYYRGFDLVRYTARHGVRPVDVDRAHPGWLDRLPPDYQVDQGRALINAAFESVKFELYGDNKADQAIRNQELLSRLVIRRCPVEALQAEVMRGGATIEQLAAATTLWRQIYDQTLRSPVAAVDEAGGGAAAPVRVRPLAVR